MGGRTLNRVLLGTMAWCGLFLAISIPAVHYRAELARGFSVAWGDGSLRVVNLRGGTPREPIRAGTEVYRGEALVGHVAADRRDGSLLVLLHDPREAHEVDVISNPTGLRWAIEALITPEVVSAAVQEAGRVKLTHSLEATFHRLTARLEQRFPEIYRQHRDQLEGEFQRLWDDLIADRGAQLTKDFILPRMSEEIPFASVAREVAYETYQEVGIRETAVAIFGDPSAQDRVRQAAIRQLADNNQLQQGLQRGASRAWADPAFQNELGRVLQRVLDDQRLRQRTGNALADSLQQLLPEIQGELVVELRALEARGLDLTSVFHALLLEPDGAMRRQLAVVVRREVLRKERYRLVIVS
jgi:hypothetical protein